MIRDYEFIFSICGCTAAYSLLPSSAPTSKSVLVLNFRSYAPRVVKDIRIWARKSIGWVSKRPSSNHIIQFGAAILGCEKIIRVMVHYHS